MPTKESLHWDWFRQQSPRLLYPSKLSEEASSTLFDEFFARTNDYCGGEIQPQVITDEEHHRAYIIFTSYGDERYFDSIEKLVAAAPDIEGWSFVALIHLSDCNHLSCSKQSNRNIDVTVIRHPDRKFTG